MNSTVFNEDCMTLMARYADNHFDLAVVDPPYGIGLLVYPDGISRVKPKAYKSTNLAITKWDFDKPTPEYIAELMRISKNQIIFGANHFIESINKNSSCWLIFDKMNGLSRHSDAELAWTSFNYGIRIAKIKWFGANSHREGKRINPTQKPIMLYDYIFNKFIPEGGKVIDTHLGSGSSRIAADRAGNIDFVGCEIDVKQFDLSEIRYKNYKAQLCLFE